MSSKWVLLLATFFSLSVSADPEDLYREPAEAPSAAPEAAATKDSNVNSKTDAPATEEESSKVRRDSEPQVDESVNKEVPKEDKVKAVESVDEKKLDQVEPDKIEDQKTKETKSADSKTSETKSKTKSQKASRRHVVLLGEFAPITTWVPLKYGGSLTVHFMQDLAIEANYMNGKLSGDSLGFDAIDDIKENRLDVLLRYYTGKTFSIFAGYSMQETETKLSTKTISENVNLPFNSTTVNAQGITMGISNRWEWKSGITFGVDWLSVFLPLSTSVDNDLRKQYSDFSNDQTYKDIEDTYEKIEDYPRLSILELGLGWTW